MVVPIFLFLMRKIMNKSRDKNYFSFEISIIKTSTKSSVAKRIFEWNYQDKVHKQNLWITKIRIKMHIK